MGQIGRHAVHWRVVDLEVAGMYDQAQRCSDRQAHGVRDAVADAKELHAEGASLDGFVGFYLSQCNAA